MLLASPNPNPYPYPYPQPFPSQALSLSLSLSLPPLTQVLLALAHHHAARGSLRHLEALLLAL